MKRIYFLRVRGLIFASGFCIFVKLKKIFTHSFSVWLSFCMLLASAGVPVFAHYCNMNSECAEVSVLPAESCCSENAPAEIPQENPEEGCVQDESCCIDKTTILKAELPAAETTTLKTSLLPVAFFAILPTATIAQFSTADIHYNLPPQHAPPLPAGRSLLAFVQILRI